MAWLDRLASVRPEPVRPPRRALANREPPNAASGWSQACSIGYFAKIASARLNALSIACSGAIPLFMTSKKILSLRLDDVADTDELIVPGLQRGKLEVGNFH